jgi:hypothetical protein
MIGNLNAELLLNRQDHLNNIKTIQTEVGGKRSLGLELKVLGNLERKRKEKLLASNDLYDKKVFFFQGFRRKIDGSSGKQIGGLVSASDRVKQLVTCK